jgi:hypothetical protein
MFRRELRHFEMMVFTGRSTRVVALALVLVVFSPPQAWCWNEQGHFLVARLAWLELTPETRAKVSRILRSHPHYEEYLTAERPVGVSTDEWAFLRAAYWPDWIRSNHSDEFSKPAWHYVPAAFTPARAKITPPEIHNEGPTVITQIPLCAEGIRTAGDVEKAIDLCWLIHLIGDIHQPLHNCSLYDEVFPQGDRGGNQSLVRFKEGEPVRLHPTWDNLFGEQTSLPAVDATIVELRELETKEAHALREELSGHLTPSEWSKEGFALARKYAYLDGDLSPANVDLNPDPAVVPSLSDTYLAGAQAAARISAIKGGHRLAAAIANATQALP